MCGTHDPRASVATKPSGDVRWFYGDRRPEGPVFHTGKQAMIKTYHGTTIKQIHGYIA